MESWAYFAILVIGAYLFGSIPVAYLAARSHGVDLREQGTHQVGGGNLWRTTSRKLGLAIGMFDFLKGTFMVAIANLVGLEPHQQLIVGLAVIVGHNWPVFLHFHGGRGIATLFGIAIIFPLVNDTSPWPVIIAAGFTFAATVALRSSPLPVLIGAASLSLTTWLFEQDIAVTLTYMVIFMVIVIKRLTAQPAPEASRISTGQLMLNRLLFDRDIADRTAWVKRQHIHKNEFK